MQVIDPRIRKCSICLCKETETITLFECECCGKVTVCAKCSPFKSPIPYLGKTRRVRICRTCIQCYSNCDPIFAKIAVTTPVTLIFNFKSYSTFAQSRSCGDVYNHCLHPSERRDKFGSRFQTVGDFFITPIWVPDLMSINCYVCKKEFTLFRRRHHCRICGKVMCSSCCSYKLDLSRFGYIESKEGLQRACNTCADRIKTPRFLWNTLPFSVQISIASFLRPSSALQLSSVDKETHRRFTSRDCDESLWQWYSHPQLQLCDILRPTQPLIEGLIMTRNPERDLQLSVRAATTSETEETGIISCTHGCHWRLEYCEKFAIPRSLSCCVFFVRYPIVTLRIAALKQLRAQSTVACAAVQRVVSEKRTMISLVRCLQFGLNEMKKSKGMTYEIQELLMMITGFLLNTTQSSKAISEVFRETEGLTSILSLLQSEYLNPRSTINTPVMIEYTSSSSRLTDSLSRNSLSSPRLSSHCRTDLIIGRDPNIIKLVQYLVGILMNLCNLDKLNCSELIGLNGIELLLSMIELTNERLMLYCLECVRACCRQCIVVKDRFENCDGLIRLINCFSCPNSQVVSSSISLTSLVLDHHSVNTRLFRLASGLHALIQTEESWNGKCGVGAAKAISNLLHGDTQMVTEFLRQRGLQRLQSLLLHQRDDLSGILFGQILNCAMYARDPLYAQAPLLSAFLMEIERYIELAEEYKVTPAEHTNDSEHPSSPQSPRSSVDPRVQLGDGSLTTRGIERSSSLSEDSRMSDLCSRVSFIEKDEKSVSRYVLSHIPTWLGFAAGAIRYLLKNEDNIQVFIDFSVEEVMHGMMMRCDVQGRYFLQQAQELIDQCVEKGGCVRRTPRPLSIRSDNDRMINEMVDRYSDLNHSPDMYSPRFLFVCFEQSLIELFLIILLSISLD